MSVTIVDEDGTHRAVIAIDGTGAWCCEAGHVEAEEAARHAWKLTRAIARHEAKASAAA
jgi:hypothetical protein